ncbi:MAG: DUF6345 domain-containing protein [Acidobacteriota bacterium]|nr:DUF6345 domain-containing protein [Acidobacteriota bacterium]
MNKMKKLYSARFYVICLGLIMLFIFMGHSQLIQSRQLQKIPLDKIALAQPKIIMEKTPLESPKGMRIFETKVLSVRTDLIQKFIAEKSLMKTPLIMKNLPQQEEIYQESEKKFTRILTNTQRGHMIVLPHLEKIAMTKAQLLRHDMAMNKAMEQVNLMQLIPRDESKVTPKQVITLTRAQVKQGEPAVVSDILQTVLFQRTLDDKPVVGKGSQLFVELGNEGKLEGYSRTWNEVIPSNLVPEFRTDQEIYDDIEKTLTTQIKGNVTVQVRKPRLIYFGDDRKFVQPAYFFTAEISSPEALGKAYYAGIVTALKNPPEPVLLPQEEKMRALPLQVSPLPKGKASGPFIPQDDPSVGRYVVRNDSNDWVDDANDFRNGLLQGHSSSSPAISFGDYYWDEPWLWTTDENSYVDKWHIVLMEGHGANWLFTTRSNCCDVVNLNAASQPGYGNRAGDSMRFLILKGCSIIPAPPDRANWPDPWWRIFKGLRQAVGFRTSMYINDNISKHFGKHLAQNCRVLDSWFHATNDCSSYSWERFWGSWGDEVYGYGAVVMIPGHEGDGIYSTAALPAATSTGLTIWWQH